MTPDKNVEDSSVETPGKSTSKGAMKTIRGVGRAVGKTAMMITAVDVIAKDVKRIRPRYPQLWKDIFNARKILRETNKKELESGGASYKVAARNAGITAAIALSVVFYLAYLISMHIEAGNTSTITKVAIITAASVALLHTIIYGWIAIKCLAKQQHNIAATARRASK